jgi:hypothetical protein
VRRAALALVLAALAAAGCADPGDRPPGSGHAADAKAFSGTTNPVYAANGWKAGDQTSWNEQMRRRAQGQNEYGRISP